MKKTFLAVLAAGMMMVGMVGMAQAIPITISDSDAGAKNGTDVGNIDTITGAKYLTNSSDGGEVAWVNGMLGTSWTVADLVKLTNQDALWNWYDTTATNVIAYDLQANGDAFYIKTGNMTLDKADGVTVQQMKDDSDLLGNLSDHFLYSNIDSTDWSVVSLNDIGITINNEILTMFGTQKYTARSSQLNIGKFSHIGEEGGNPVPEPATMLLMGTGLLGLLGVRRK